MRSVSMFLAVLALLLPSAGWCAAPPRNVPNELPRSWRLDEIAKATPPFGTGGRACVLAWKIIQDDRPFRVESCLVMKVPDKDDGNGRWVLAHLYRHPEDKKPEWRLSQVHVMGVKGTRNYPGIWLFQDKSFKKRPDNKSIYSSLGPEEVGWSFEHESGWQYVGCGVCEKSWLEAVGEKPTRFFGPPLRRR